MSTWVWTAIELKRLKEESMKKLPAEAIEEIRKGHKLTAIKIVRETWGLGLKVQRLRS